MPPWNFHFSSILTIENGTVASSTLSRNLAVGATSRKKKMYQNEEQLRELEYRSRQEWRGIKRIKRNVCLVSRGEDREGQLAIVLGAPQ